MERYSYFKRIISKYDVVTFDVFDTVLKRNVRHPRDVFSLVATLDVKYKDFAQYRIEAEAAAREVAENGEATYEDIYAKLPYTEDEKNILKEKELALEKQVLVSNIKVYDVYCECLRQNKRVFFISDMYHSKDTIAKWLGNCGYDKYEDIIVSCDYKLKKKDGSLFKALLQRENIKPQNILHFGNSKKSDILGAAIAGIRACYIPTWENNTEYLKPVGKTLGDSYLTALVNNNIRTMDSRAALLGYEVVGPIVLGYCKWLNRFAKNIDTILFLSRDMHLFYDAYIKMYSDDASKCHYVRISRQSILAAVMSSTDDYYFINRQWSDKKVSPRTLMDRAGLDVNDYIEELRTIGISDFDKIDDSITDSRHPIWNFLRNHKPDIINANKEEHMAIVSYLKQYLVSGSIAICDLGWHSTIQVYLETIAKAQFPNCSMEGFYVGTFGAKEGYILKEKGFLFDKNHINPYFGTGSFLLETLCLELCGSVKKYEIAGEEISVITDACDQDNVNYIRAVHEGCRRLIAGICNNDIWKYVSLSKKQIVQPYLELLNNPKDEELRDFRKVSYFDRGKFSIIDNKKRRYYVLHPVELKKDLLNARWKGGFLTVFTGIKCGWQGKYYKMAWKK